MRGLSQNFLQGKPRAFDCRAMEIEEDYLFIFNQKAIAATRLLFEDEKRRV